MMNLLHEFFFFNNINEIFIRENSTREGFDQLKTIHPTNFLAWNFIVVKEQGKNYSKFFPQCAHEYVQNRINRVLKFLSDTSTSGISQNCSENFSRTILNSSKLKIAAIDKTNNEISLTMNL